MLKKFLSTFKVLKPAAQNPAETEAADAISTPEKAADLVVRLEAAIAAPATSSSRLPMLRKQHGQALLASRRHQVESEFQRVAAALLRDKTIGEKNLEKAKQEFAQADGVFQQKKAQHLAVLARKEPLVAQMTLTMQNAGNELRDAQAAFDAAVLKGDDTAEVRASEAIYKLQTEAKNPVGPLQLRLDAIGQQEIAIQSELATAEQNKNDANELVLRAHATLALVEYDRQVQALLDAFVAQSVAVRKCGSGAFSGATVDSFDTQVSSAERIVFGQRLDAFSNRKLSAFTVRDMIVDMTTEPNLEILATNVEALPELPDEPTNSRPVPGGLVMQANGAYQTFLAQSSDDEAQAQAA